MAFRVERQWISVKLYVPSKLYSQLQALIDSDPLIYQRLKMNDSNETDMNAIILYAIQGWIEMREEIEERNGTNAYRKEHTEAAQEGKEGA